MKNTLLLLTLISTCSFANEIKNVEKYIDNSCKPYLISSTKFESIYRTCNDTIYTYSESQEGGYDRILIVKDDGKVIELKLNK